MIHGIGVDIVSVAHMEGLRNRYNDPFFQKTYTVRERETALQKKDPIHYFAGRFASKEAVFKALHISPDAIRLNEIETLNDEMGCPYVNLFGQAKEVMEKAGFTRILISLSGDNGLIIAFAVCEV